MLPQAMVLLLAGAATAAIASSNQASSWSAAVSKQESYDVVVYGGTPGGITSAIAALQTGFAPRQFTVALVNPSGHLGGMVAGGLGHTDIGDSKVVGGLAAAFFRDVCNGTGSGATAVSSGPCYDFPPSWAEATYERMLSNAADDRLTVYKRYRVVSSTVAALDPGLEVRARPAYGPRGLRADPSDAGPARPSDSVEGSTGPAITCIQLVQQTGILSDPAGVQRDEERALREGSALELCASVFIDASYEADLAAVAGADLAYGREGISAHNESMAGMLSNDLESSYGNFANQFHVPLNSTDGDGNLLPLLYGGPLSAPGEPDNHTMAYNYRMCLAKKSAGKSLPLPLPPGGYDPTYWELLRRYIATLKPSAAEQLSSYIRVQWLDPTAPDKSDVNNNGPITTDYSQGSWDYPLFNWTRRREIVREHIDYTAGLLHFLAQDPAVPGAVHDAMAQLGLPSDEFTDATETGIRGWPYQLYVREANRLQGQYIFLQMDRSDPSRFRKNTTIGLLSYNIDVHHGVRYVRSGEGNSDSGSPVPTVWNEGNFDRWHSLGPADIPFEVLVPRDDGRQPSNLLVPVSPSSTHVGLGCLRLEPQYMIMGQAAGTAAVLALDEGAKQGAVVPVQRVNITELQERLVAHGQILKI